MSVAAIHRRRRWSPPARAKIDRGHPLAQGLVCFAVPGLNIDFAASRTIFAPRATVPTALAPAPAFTDSAVDGYDLGNRSDLNFSTPYSVFAGVIPTGTPGPYRHVFGRANNSGTVGAWTWSLYLQNGTQPRFGATGIALITDAATLTLNQYAQIGMVRTGSSHQIWINNALSGTASSQAAFPSSLSSSNSFWIGERTGDVGNLTPHAQIPWVAAWARSLSATEVAQLNADPFCMLTRGW